MELRSWFLEPISGERLRWTHVRIWGLPVQHPSKWWRSSSIRARVSRDHLTTRFGTAVRLRGGIAKPFARALCMPEHTLLAFSRGFPPDWESRLERHPVVRRSRRLAAATVASFPHHSSDDAQHDHPKHPHPSWQPCTDDEQLVDNHPRPAVQRRLRKPPSRRASANPARSNPASHPPKPAKHHRTARKPVKSTLKPPVNSCAINIRQLTDQPPSQDQKQKVKPKRKRVAFAEVNQRKPSVLRPQFPRLSKDAENLTSVASWTQEQKDAFERQRNTIPADKQDYWDRVAAGVQGKTAEECQELWESAWATSPEPAKVKNGSSQKVYRSPKVATPEVVMHVQKAASRKRLRNTAKFRTGVRRLADVIARETCDDLLEPQIVTPKLEGISLKDATGFAPSLGNDGTPGTEVRRKRQQISEDGELATPEMFTKGKSFGLREADHYVSLFKRRLGTARIPNLKRDPAGNGKAKKKEQGASKAKLVQKTYARNGEKDTDCESDRSDESDLFF